MIRVSTLFIFIIISYCIQGQSDTLRFGDGYVSVQSKSEKEVVCEIHGNFNYEGYGPDGDIPLGNVIFRSLQHDYPELSDSVIIELYSKSQQDGIPDYESKNYFDFDSKSIISLEDINRSTSKLEGKQIGLESFYPISESINIDCDLMNMKAKEIMNFLSKKKGNLHKAYVHSSSPLIIKFTDKKSQELLIITVQKGQECHLKIYSKEDY